MFKKRFALLLIAVILISSLALFTSCTKNDNENNNQSSEESQAQDNNTNSDKIENNSDASSDNTEETSKDTKVDLFPVEINDLAGRTITIEKQPEKIVSLSPANTEILFALGVGEKVIGVTSYCNYPADTEGIDKIGDFEGPNIELITAKKPDLVVAQGYLHEDIIKQLDELSIPLVSTESSDFSSAYKSLEILAKATGTSAKAESIATEMKNKVDEISAKTKDAKKVKVLYIVEYSEDLWTVSEGSFIHDIINFAGGENIVKDAESTWCKYSLEKIVEENPDYILINPYVSEEAIKSDDALKQTNAVKNGNIYLYENEDIISRNSPRIVQALEETAKALHPELFE